MSNISNTIYDSFKKSSPWKELIRIYSPRLRDTSIRRLAPTSCGMLLPALLIFAAYTSAQAQSPALRTLYNFASYPGDGSSPEGGVAIGKSGVPYGATTYGGTGACPGPPLYPGCGTVFSLTPPAAPGGAWTESVLYSFAGGPTDGMNPQSGIAVGDNGVLYGTTYYGGTGVCYGPSGAELGCGTVFSLTPPVSPGGAWTEAVLHNFTGGTDGNWPAAGVAIGKGGVLYGTTDSVNYYCLDGCGTVFSLTPPASPGGAWTETVLHNFVGTDGANPFAGVVIGKGGVLYGTTSYGGTGSCLSGQFYPGCGTVFSLIPPASPGGAWKQRVLYNFTYSDGFDVTAGVAIGKGGVLYGTTYHTGSSNAGTVFSLTPPASPGGAWAEAVLYSFTGGGDGGSPVAGVAIGTGEVLYGTTFYGGTSNAGTVFSLNPPTSPGGAWTESVLYNFTGGADGDAIQAGVVIGKGGVLYGTASFGGNSYAGTVFAVKP